MRAEVFGLGSSEESRANIPGRVPTGSYRYKGNWGEEAEIVGGAGIMSRKIALVSVGWGSQMILNLFKAVFPCKKHITTFCSYCKRN